MINVLIVEDCPLQRKNLISILKELQYDLNIYSASNQKDAIEICISNHINLLFVDVMLEDSTGINFAKEIRKLEKYKLTWIIFITTFEDYMVQAFKEIHCYDYILKPYNKEEIKKTASLLIENKYKNEKTSEEEKKYAVFKLKGIFIKVYIDEILFVEVKLRNSIVHTKKQVYSVNRHTLKKILEMTNVEYIVKTHKAFAVNANHVEKIQKVSRGCWEIHFPNYEHVALVSSTYKDDLDKLINV